MKFLKISLLIALFVVPGCGGGNSTPTSPSLNIPFSATDLVVGTGTEAVAGKTLRMYYSGWLYSAGSTENKGTRFDSNTGGLGFSFVLGSGNVIQGWNQGITGMKVGGKRLLIIPPELAYGATGAGNGAIPGNATLIFEVELLGVAG